jgi:hypothetical protein
MGKSITKKTSDFQHWNTHDQFGAFGIKYSKLSFLKKLFIPFPGIHFFLGHPPTENKKKVKLNLSLSSPNSFFAAGLPQKKIYLTDKERNLTFAGTVESFEELKGKIRVLLLDVQVYEYSSSNPLYYLPRICISRPKDKLYQEEF